MVIGFGLCDLYAHVWLGEDLSQVTEIYIVFCFILLCSWSHSYPFPFIGAYRRVNAALGHCELISDFANETHASIKPQIVV